MKWAFSIQSREKNVFLKINTEICGYILNGKNEAARRAALWLEILYPLK
jgi:hypothetical protein